MYLGGFRQTLPLCILRVPPLGLNVTLSCANSHSQSGFPEFFEGCKFVPLFIVLVFHKLFETCDKKF